jgi:putative FmdB family regulatory protein
MPLYEYECGNCGKRFEKIEKVNSASLRKCPKCGGKAHRLLAAPAIQFKGAGWYVTDYARKSAAPESKEAGATEKSAPPASAGSTESKPAAPAKEKKKKAKDD